MCHSCVPQNSLNQTVKNKMHVTKNIMRGMQLYGARKAYTCMNMDRCVCVCFCLCEIFSVVTTERLALQVPSTQLSAYYCEWF